MARSRLCRICRDFHDVDAAWPEACVGHFGSADSNPTFHVISDTMEPVRSMVSGRMHDSKSRYRAEVHAAGCRIVGNDKLERSVKPISRPGADIKRVIQQLS